MTRSSPLPGITLLSLFFLFGTVMSGLAAVMPSFPGSVLEPLWRLNPHAREGFAAMGGWAVLLMARCVWHAALQHRACGAASAGAIGRHLPFLRSTLRETRPMR
jgi:hypothetical protein